MLGTYRRDYKVSLNIHEAFNGCSLKVFVGASKDLQGQFDELPDASSLLAGEPLSLVGPVPILVLGFDSLLFLLCLLFEVLFNELPFECDTFLGLLSLAAT
jgi:hypothetical protein